MTNNDNSCFGSAYFYIPNFQDHVYTVPKYLNYCAPGGFTVSTLFSDNALPGTKGIYKQRSDSLKKPEK